MPTTSLAMKIQFLRGGGALLALYGPNTFVPITAICKRQRRVAHSSTESEMITLETGLRCEALPYMALWDAVLHTFAPIHGASSESSECPVLPPRLSHVKQTSIPERSRLVVLEDSDQNHHQRPQPSIETSSKSSACVLRLDFRCFPTPRSRTQTHFNQVPVG